MTSDTIETARQAGFVLEGDLSGAGRLPMLLERFKDLVRAKVLEEAAQVCEQWGAWNNVAQECAGAIRGMADSGHSTARSGEAPTTPPPDPQLCKFYAVETWPELVAAMLHHITKLQAKLPPTPSLAPQRVREG